jgi:catechol 2,3-dioxygenase-like lactoylglutathione lyase family enzyme
MRPDLDLILGQYEAGRISRRELLGTLAALMIPVTLPAQTEPVIGMAKHLNHATLMVSDVQRSRRFYQELFGMPVLTVQGRGVNLRVGSSFIGLYPVDQGEPARIDHVCLALEGFDADAVRAKLGSRGVEATIRLRDDTKELYFTDPDGIRIQLQDVRYRGGTGPLGDRDPR